MKLICDICGDDMEREIIIKSSYGRVRKVKNIGIIIHREDGKIIKRCRRCHMVIKQRNKRKKKLPNDWSHL